MKYNSRLKLWHRILLVALTGTLPLVAILTFVISSSINKDIDFGKQEIKGNVFQRPLERLLDLVGQHQYLARRAALGDASSKAELDALSQQIDSGFEDLGKVYKDLGEDLQFTDEGLASRKRENAKLSTVLSDWQTLKSSPVEIAAKGEVAARLVTAIRTMITQAGDTSNLILDPDLDSYYLMDTTLCRLPQTQERLSEITVQVADWIRSGTVEQNKVQIAVMAALLQQADEDGITGDAQTVIAEDKNFYGISESLQRNLPPAVASYVELDQKFIALLNKIVAGEKIPDAAAAVEKAGWATRAESFRLYATGVDELDRLLQIRVAAYQHRRLVSFESVGLTLVLVGIVMWLIVRNLNKSLRSLTENLGEGAAQVASASTQISHAGQGLAESASSQAASVEETSASVQELSSATARNTASAAKANELAKQARAAADRGTADMHSMGDAMVAIKSSSDDIAKIIKTIDEIAFQTNILALNAAVEAARAGEAGMGFAVVADEVRNLAQRSAQAAKETASKIEGAIAKANQGVAISATVNNSLAEIVGKIREVDELVSEVAQATHDQMTGLNHINTAVSSIDKLTQGNAAAAEESAAAAEELSAQAAVMNEAVGGLLELAGGSRRTATAVSAPRAVAEAPKKAAPKPAQANGSGFTYPARNGSSNGVRKPSFKVSLDAERRSEIPLEDDFKTDDPS